MAPKNAKAAPAPATSATPAVPATTAKPQDPTLPIYTPRIGFLFSGLTAGLSRWTLATLLLLYIFFVHAAGLYIFTKGFLLTRLSIPSVSPPYNATHSPPLPPTHSKALILIIDALRTDFISPHHPSPPSPFHHGILSLPAELSASTPDHSLIFNTYSDPPTTTMQRIKGITTGSLPTFVDAGANFASTAIEEDSIISQLVSAGKTLGFMGDDTWANLFPSSFALSHPYDSFNVEDLHTVDNGVIEHLIPYLQPSNRTQWDVLIGHFLGVDHVGHRVGPERDTMRIKLSQMDQVLREVVELLDDDTLLVVLGDHGMDSKGNHGGDSDMETSAAMWLYSKGRPLTSATQQTSSWPTYLFPGSSTPLRHINQIDIVPTLSLLLGVPIPFNNLGSVIPEVFPNPVQLEIASRVNAEQIKRYISEYGDNAIGEKVWEPWTQAILSRDRTLQESIEAHRDFSLFALAQLRSLWAQFSLPHIILGLSILAMSITMLLTLYLGIRNTSTRWDVFVRMTLDTILFVTLVSTFSYIFGYLVPKYATEPFTILVSTAFMCPFVISVPLLLAIRIPSFSSLKAQRVVGPLILLVHALSFASNSFIMWEDRILIFLLGTIMLVHLWKSVLAPTADMRIRLVILLIAFMIIMRVVGIVTVCREEQQPYCHVTFYSGSLPVAPQWIMVAIIPLATQLPRIIAIFLNRSKSLAGPARFYLGTAFRIILVLNAVYWVLEYAESWEGLTPDAVPFVQLGRLWIARLSLGAIVLVLPYVWATSGLCISIDRTPSQTGEEQAVKVLGFANSFGSTYLLFLLIPYALTSAVMLPTAQLSISAILTSILLHLEMVDTQHDATIMHQSFSSSSNPGAFEPGSGTALVRPGFTEVVPLVLVGLVGFFATGHQAVLTSIQWKAAFFGFKEVTWPWSPLLVILNTWGPTLLSAIAAPLLALWNVSPRPQSNIPVLTHALQISIAFMLYHTTITFASALCSAWLRRHLMVWKVFAPRFMLAAVTLLVVDIGLILAVTIGVRVTSWKVWRTFNCESI